MSATMNLFGYVGEAGCSVAAVAQFLSENPQSATVLVNSPGGVATDGAAICALFERHGNVTAYIAGLAASAASLMIMGAQTIVMHRASHLMIHDPSAMVFGRSHELRDAADTLDKLAGTYAEIYARSSGNPAALVAQWMDDETWLTAHEAEALNFCDSVDDESERSKPVAAFDYARFKAAPQQLLQAAKDNGWGTASPVSQLKGIDV